MSSSRHYSSVHVIECCVCVGSAAVRASSAILPTSSVTSSGHVTSAVTTRRLLTSDDAEFTTLNDFTTSMLIGEMLFVPVTVILCVTVIIRLRRSGTPSHLIMITSLPKVIWEQGRVAVKVSPHWLQWRAPNSPPKIPFPWTDPKPHYLPRGD